MFALINNILTPSNVVILPWKKYMNRLHVFYFATLFIEGIIFFIFIDNFLTQNETIASLAFFAGKILLYDLRKLAPGIKVYYELVEHNLNKYYFRTNAFVKRQNETVIVIFPGIDETEERRIELPNTMIWDQGILESDLE